MSLILDVANTSEEPALISHTEFYSETLDNVDLFREYTNWQDPAQQNGFSFCQYPFLLTISAKRFILQKDSEQQMISQARVRQLLISQSKTICVFIYSLEQTVGLSMKPMTTRHKFKLVFRFVLQKTIVAQVQSKQAPELQALFLNLKVRRRNLVADSLNEVSTNQTPINQQPVNNLSIFIAHQMTLIVQG